MKNLIPYIKIISVTLSSISSRFTCLLDIKVKSPTEKNKNPRIKPHVEHGISIFNSQIKLHTKRERERERERDTETLCVITISGDEFE